MAAKIGMIFCIIHDRNCGILVRSKTIITFNKWTISQLIADKEITVNLKNMVRHNIEYQNYGLNFRSWQDADVTISTLAHRKIDKNVNVE